MLYKAEFINIWSSFEKIDQPSNYLESFPDEIYNLLTYEIESILKNPFDPKRTHELRYPWKGFFGWYPEPESKISEYRIIYKVQKKVQIFRIGHHSVVYKK